MESVAGIFWVVILGLCTGSLAGAAVVRLPARLSMFYPPSHCPACGAHLGFLDLIPLLSWAISRCRCRHCGDAVSGQYSAVETLVGAGFLAAWLTSGATLFGSGLAVIHATLLAVLFTCLVIASLVDLSHWYVPRSLILLVGTAGIFDSYLAAVPIPQILSNGLLAMAAPALLKGGYRVLRHRDGLGWDDVLLFLVGGFWLSSGEIVLWWTIGPLFSVIGAVIAGVRRPRDRVPMAPGLSAALSLILLLRPFGLAP